MSDAFWAVVDDLTAQDGRYARDAYAFVVESLETAVQRKGRRGHVSAAELLDGLVNNARARLGVMSWTVLEHWGVRHPTDVGEIVFALIDRGLLSRRDEDSRGDFDIDLDFRDALERNYFDLRDAPPAPSPESSPIPRPPDSPDPPGPSVG